MVSDGEDEASRYSLDEVLDFAHRSGLTLYTIGLDTRSRSIGLSNALERLARETGGQSFSVPNARGLERVYEAIQEEVRSQYLLAYQSHLPDGDGGYRRVEVKVHKPGLKAKTVPGYYP